MPIGVGLLLFFCLAAEQTTHAVLQSKPLFTKETLGTPGLEILQNPDKVTVQAVSPFAGSKVGKTAPYPPIGIEREVNELLVRLMSRELSGSLPPHGSYCTFSPDHVITFTKGNRSIQFVTCFSCYQLVADFEGKKIGAPLMPSVQDTILSTFNWEELAFAAASVRFGENTMNLVKVSKGAKIYKTKPFGSFGTPIPNDLKLEFVRYLDERDCEDLFDQLLEGAYKDWRKIRHRSDAIDLQDAFVIQFNTKPRLEMFINQNLGLQLIKVDGQLTDPRSGFGGRIEKLKKALFGAKAKI